MKVGPEKHRKTALSKKKSCFLFDNNEHSIISCNLKEKVLKMCFKYHIC